MKAILLFAILGFTMSAYSLDVYECDLQANLALKACVENLKKDAQVCFENDYRNNLQQCLNGRTFFSPTCFQMVVEIFPTISAEDRLNLCMFNPESH